MSKTNFICTMDRVQFKGKIIRKDDIVNADPREFGKQIVHFLNYDEFIENAQKEEAALRSAADLNEQKLIDENSKQKKIIEELQKQLKSTKDTKKDPLGIDGGK